MQDEGTEKQRHNQSYLGKVIKLHPVLDLKILVSPFVIF